MVTLANIVRVVIVVAVVVYAAPYVKSAVGTVAAPLNAMGKLEKTIR